MLFLFRLQNYSFFSLLTRRMIKMAHSDGHSTKITLNLHYHIHHHVIFPSPDSEPNIILYTPYRLPGHPGRGRMCRCPRADSPYRFGRGRSHQFRQYPEGIRQRPVFRPVQGQLFHFRHLCGPAPHKGEFQYQIPDINIAASHQAGDAAPQLSVSVLHPEVLLERA